MTDVNDSNTGADTEELQAERMDDEGAAMMNPEVAGDGGADGGADSGADAGADGGADGSAG